MSVDKLPAFYKGRGSCLLHLGRNKRFRGTSNNDAARDMHAGTPESKYRHHLLSVGDRLGELGNWRHGLRSQSHVSDF